MIPLDDLDRRLIGLLRADARLPNATLARHLGVSRGTVQNRLDRMTAGGVLLGYTVRLSGDAGGAAVQAVMSIEVRSADTRAVVMALRRMPEVGRVWSTNGRWDSGGRDQHHRPRRSRPVADRDPGAFAGGQLRDQHPARRTEVAAGSGLNPAGDRPMLPFGSGTRAGR